MNKFTGRLGFRGRLLLQSTLVLLVMLGSLVWLGRGQMLGQYTQQRLVVVEQQQRLLGSLLQAAAEATLGLAGPVSSILGMSEDNLPDVNELGSRIGQNEDSLAVEFGLEALALYNAQGELLFARDLYGLGDYETDWLAGLARKALAQGSPSTDLRCRPACRLTVLAPVIGGNGQVYLLALSRSVGQVLVDFQRISQADLILLAPAKDADACCWGRSVGAATGLGQSQEWMKRLGERLSLPDAGAQMRLDDAHRSYELQALAGAFLAPGHLWLVLSDVSLSQAQISQDTSVLTWMVILIVMALGVAMLIMLRRPTQITLSVAAALPMLAERRYDDARERLGRETDKPRDEVDLLRSIARHLTDDLETIESQLSAQSQELRRSNTELAQLAEELEQRVRQRTAELAKARDAAVVASASKSQFLANMSHEIRTPMNGVLGMAQLLMDAELPVEQKEDVAVLKDSAESLLTLLNDILDLSKIEAGQMSLREDDYDLHALLKQVLQLARGSGEGKGLQLKMEMDETVPQWQFGDAVRLRQVLSNLIGNAIKFTDKGHVILHASPDPENDKNLLVVVEDTGVGIAAEHQQRIFDEFAQADESSTRRAEGTGLGLAICQRLVGMMGGRLWLESELGKGSRFCFSVPMQAPKNTQAGLDAVVDTEAELPALNVLVVEDNAVNRLLMEKSLTRMGHETTMAINGREAVELVANSKFDVILMDLQMPEMDGFEATQKIMQDTDNQAWILGVTASVTTDTIEECEAVGMRAVLPKPVLLPDLRKRLQEAWLAQQAA